VSYAGIRYLAITRDFDAAKRRALKTNELNGPHLGAVDETPMKMALSGRRHHAQAYRGVVKEYRTVLLLRWMCNARTHT
jgi:hypothetical protein